MAGCRTWKFASGPAFAVYLLPLVVSSLVVASCGSTDGVPNEPPTTTGQFIDDPVQGLQYSCSSGGSGVTDGNGDYVCSTGDDVTFSLGSLVLGTVAVQEAPITPYSFFPSDTAAAINLARLLQALDSDGLPNNGVIVIDAGLAALLPTDTDFSSPTFETDIENALVGIELPSPEEAQARLNEAIIQSGGSIPNGGHIPVADAGLDQSVVTASSVTLDGSGSSDADGDALSYDWSLVVRPPGSRAALSDASALAPTFTADVDGAYVVQLIVHDGTVSSSADTVTITAGTGNAIPIADAGVDQDVLTDVPVTLDGSGSSDADGDALSYAWVFVSIPSGSNAALTDAATASPEFTPDVDGAYVVQLEVDDGAYADTDTVSIAATSNQKPVADAGATQHVATDSTVTLDGSGSYDDDGDDLVYRWTMVERPFGSNAALLGAATVDPTFTTDLNGTFIVELVVNDGRVDSDSSTVFIVSHPAVAETAPALEWIVETGTTSFERANDIAVDSSANVYITGYTRGSLDGNPSSGYNDIFIAKYNSDGDRQWTTQVVGTGDAGNSGEVARGIAIDDARNVLYVVGSTTGDLNGQPNSGLNDFFITKYDTDGVHQWTVVNGTAFSDLGWDVAVDTAGDVYLTGMTEGALEGNTQHGGRDIFISKYDADGVHQWTAQPGTNNYEYGYGIAVDPGSNAYVVGYSGAGLDGNTHLGQTDIIVTKYNTNGVRQWTQQLGTASFDIGKAIAVDSSGNVYLTGDTDGVLGSAANGETDAFVAKLDTDGAFQWAAQLGTGAEDWSYGIALDSEGSVHVSGYTAGTLSGNVSQGTTDYFIAKYSTGGLYQWSLQDGRELEDWSFALAIDPFNNIYATGVTHALLPNRASSEDIFIARYGDYAVTGGGLYTVGGTVMGTLGTFTLTNNGGDDITIAEDGSFTFPTGLPDGASYSVEASGYDGGGVIPGANVTNIVVACHGV